jgi:Protein of unknown function (DUF3102)
MSDVIILADPVLADHAAEIRRLGKRVVADVIEIGRRLAECKRICGHGHWLAWLEREFGWTDKTAENFINVCKLGGKIENFSNLDLPLSGLYLLAAPSTPATAREKIIERAQAGEQIPVAEIKQTIEAAKGRQRPAIRRTTADLPPVSDEVRQERAAAAERIRALKGWAEPGDAPGAGVANQLRDDIGPTSSGETERLRTRCDELAHENHRLQCENIALRSEVRELRAELAKRPPRDLNDPGSMPECLRRVAP